MNTESWNVLLVVLTLAFGIPGLYLYAKGAARADRRRDRAGQELLERRERRAR